VRHSLPLFFLVLACRGDKAGLGAGDSAASDGGADTDANEVVLTAALTDDVATVLRVRWSTPTPSSGVIEFGETTAYGHRTAATAEGTEHEALLLGMPAETEVHFRLVDATTGEPGPDHSASTGFLPAELPTLVASGQATSWDGWLVVPINGTANGVVILDDRGRIVWYHLAQSTANVLSAFAAPDRQSLVYCQPFGERDGAPANALRVSMDGSTEEVLDFEHLSHHCVGLPDGTIAAPVPDPRLEHTKVFAEQLVELAPDGSTTVIWSAWDWLETLVEDPYTWAEENAAEGSWSHVVATDYYEESNTYVLSLKDLGTQVCIDRATGEVLWALNGVLNQFSYTDGSEGTTDVVHQLELDGDQLLLFDNGGQDREGSMIQEWGLDVERMEVALDWSYFPEPGRYNYALGDVRRVDGDAVQVVWSVLGQIQDLDRDGETLWQLDVDLGTAFGFTTHHASLYP
jgi:hypothetical protein